MWLRLLSCTAVFATGCANAPSGPAIGDDHPASPSAAAAYAAPPDAFAAPAATGNEPTHVHAAPAAGAVYTCPHHPEVQQTTPGICPKCKMKLRPAIAAPATTHDHGGHR